MNKLDTEGKTIKELFPGSKEKEMIAKIKTIITKETQIDSDSLKFVEKRIGKAIHYHSNRVGKFEVCLLTPLLIVSGSDEAQLNYPVKIFHIRGLAELSTEISKENQEVKVRVMEKGGKFSLETNSRFSLHFKTSDFLALIIHKVK